MLLSLKPYPYSWISQLVSNKMKCEKKAKKFDEPGDILGERFIDFQKEQKKEGKAFFWGKHIAGNLKLAVFEYQYKSIFCRCRKASDADAD
ncbi:MAG: hypothetical protein MI784_18380 [Cytophagales bacterium]|nr:hypothetical protein [Cytophagales bacterium]